MNFLLEKNLTHFQSPEKMIDTNGEATNFILIVTKLWRFYLLLSRPQLILVVLREYIRRMLVALIKALVGIVRRAHDYFIARRK